MGLQCRYFGHWIPHDESQGRRAVAEDRNSYTYWLERCERLVASRLLPDAAIRLGVRIALRRRLRWLGRERSAMRDQVSTVGPIAVETETANRQHYELPAEFFFVSCSDHDSNTAVRSGPPM